MADPLSISASVIAIITAFLQTSKIVVDFVDSVKDAPTHIKTIAGDIKVFRGSLSVLEQTLLEPEMAAVADENLSAALEGLQEAIQSSDDALKQALKLFKPPEASSSRARTFGQPSFRFL